MSPKTPPAVTSAPGARTAHDERTRVRVVARGEGNNVIAPLELSERVVRRVSAKFDGARTRLDVHDADEAKNLARGGGGFLLLENVAVVLREFLHELFHALDVSQRLRNEGLDRNIGKFEFKTTLARQDGDLSSDIHTTQVVGGSGSV